MNGRGLAWDLGKYVLTGVLSFIAALVYTEFRLKPVRNVSLVPLTMERHDTCDVKHQKLSEAIQRLGADTAGAPQEDSYASYLKALQSQPPAGDTKRWVVLKNLAPQELVPQLVQEGIFQCEHRDPNNQRDWRYNTFLVVQVAVLLHEPTAYVFKRSCSLSYQGAEIPLRASMEEISITALASIKTDPEMLVVGQTRALFLRYDTQEADQIQQGKFTDLVKKMDEKKVEVIIKCTVIQEEGEQPIGRTKPYSVSVRTFL
jgi:hypothetical protein